MDSLIPFKCLSLSSSGVIYIGCCSLKVETISEVDPVPLCVEILFRER